MTILRTPRLVLRPLGVEDTAAVAALFGDPEVTRFHGDDLDNPDRVTAMIDRRLGYRGPRGTGDWVFTRDGQVVGIGHVRVSTELPGGVIEVGWYLASGHWGTGLAEEAARALVDHAHHTLGAPVVFALVHQDNDRGLRFVRRLGFHDVGRGEHYGATHRVLVSPRPTGGVHHVELWVADLATAEKSLGWLLVELGWREYQRWDRGVSWRLGSTYVVVEDSPDRVGEVHDRRRPGLNHLALHVRTRTEVDRITAAAAGHGWRLMFADRHPYAGGPDHYAAYLHDDAGFELELVAADHMA
ncbi:GNAT family N-acetyltransferase [Actinophytocola xinjiangensis]|uniref:GNAT family N-acetyltransferase n=1 Tax=Actinophytocola xinjiangensis TaxID=485602 RepID=A0A7Z1B1C6_9PSEU|nr:GNAT family N-acetyltransferase [Actinophytocola xinjiangensis]OLF13717.1 GNAT family N-acetyltransferase [Actinophytocola xinjiangensis]